MTFCGSFRKNVAGIECATHDERLYNACIWLKKIQFAKNFLKMPKSHLGHFQKRSSGSFWDVLENFAKFTGNDLYWSLFLIKLQSSILQTPAARAFSCELCGIFKNTSGWLVFQALGKMPLGKMFPGKSPPRKLTPGKLPPRKLHSGKLPNEKLPQPPIKFFCGFFLISSFYFYDNFRP